MTPALPPSASPTIEQWLPAPRYSVLQGLPTMPAHSPVSDRICTTSRASDAATSSAVGGRTRAYTRMLPLFSCTLASSLPFSLTNKDSLREQRGRGRGTEVAAHQKGTPENRRPQCTGKAAKKAEKGAQVHHQTRHISLFCVLWGTGLSRRHKHVTTLMLIKSLESTPYPSLQAKQDAGSGHASHSELNAAPHLLSMRSRSSPRQAPSLALAVVGPLDDVMSDPPTPFSSSLGAPCTR